MSKKKRKTKKTARGTSEGDSDAVPTSHRLARATILRCLAAGALCTALIAGLCLGGERLEGWVHDLERYDRPLTLQWVDLPDWLRLEDNRHILDQLARRVDLQDSDRMLDSALPERIGRALSAPEVGWVQSVDCVTVRPDGVVSVACHFRRPTAWVHRGAYCYLVDGDGYRLPGRYDIADCRGSSLLMIAGVESAPPRVGRHWPGADLGAGLRLVSLLGSKPFRHQIADIIVSNHGGRRDRHKPHIELATDRPDARIWWGRPPDEEYGTEITAAQKITLLDTLYRRWGRIDMNRAYVNIMTWPDRVAMPVLKPAPKRPRLLRG